ncbi:hypothetical protein DB32_000651 [Sandaracinus amylolyticus]|uniref:Uncharacterized protein n=1 Tax=Sandaracinus amylolyticus TaxID=927083 RepID=A0A0F6VZK4_9BACT|nr:hypothetical protein DB32_000651 [Sandaracinus amylolyticus]
MPSSSIDLVLLRARTRQRVEVLRTPRSKSCARGDPSRARPARRTSRLDDAHAALRRASSVRGSRARVRCAGRCDDHRRAHAPQRRGARGTKSLLGEFHR